MKSKLDKHNEIMEQINRVYDIEDLPKVSYSKVSSLIIKKLGLKDITSKELGPFIKVLKEEGNFTLRALNELASFINLYSLDLSSLEIERLCLSIYHDREIRNLLSEIIAKNNKASEIQKWEDLDNHKQIMRLIKYSFDINKLPKINYGDLNQRVLRAVNNNRIYKQFKVSDISDLVKIIYAKEEPYDLKKAIYNMLKDKTLNGDLLIIDEEELGVMVEQIYNSIINDNKIEYIIEEIKAKEARKLYIYEQNHREIMEAIKCATRISQLPPNLSESTLTSYIYGNSTIIPNDNRFKTEDFKVLASLLINGYKITDNEVFDEIDNIITKRYPECIVSARLAFKNKLLSLPRLDYLREEIKAYKEKEQLFLSTQNNNVNVYFIENTKSPIDGGKFYNCYINREGNLNLTDIIPLNLDELVPEGMDIDAIEWWIQSKYDPTFKAAGGIILKRDETIGNITVFKPNDGKVGVTLEEKNKIDEINDLDKQIEAKKRVLLEIEEQISQREEYVKSGIDRLFEEYKNKVLVLQSELFEKIDTMKSSFTTDEITKKLI